MKKKIETKIGRGTYVNKKRTSMVKITKYNSNTIEITHDHEPFRNRTIPQIISDLKRRWIKL